MLRPQAKYGCRRLRRRGNSPRLFRKIGNVGSLFADTELTVPRDAASVVYEKAQNIQSANRNTLGDGYVEGALGPCIEEGSGAGARNWRDDIVLPWRTKGCRRLFRRSPTVIATNKLPSSMIVIGSGRA